MKPTKAAVRSGGDEMNRERNMVVAASRAQNPLNPIITSSLNTPCVSPFLNMSLHQILIYETC